jgi:hypothetical protein
MRTDSLLGLADFFHSLDIAVQCGFGDLERPADLHNGMVLVVKILSNTALFANQGFGSATSSSPSSGSTQSCLRPFPDQVSLKFSKSAEDMKD